MITRINREDKYPLWNKDSIKNLSKVFSFTFNQKLKRISVVYIYTLKNNYYFLQYTVPKRAK